MNTLKKTINIMNSYGITANKRFGQNFLIDDDILNGIIDASNIGEQDIVIEIGPGLGNLTEYLLEKAGFVILIEIDKNMIKILQDRFKDKNNYIILNKDVLKTDIDQIVESVEKENKFLTRSVKVVANLPYYITTPILFKLLQDSNRIEEIIVMVQKEVAERMVAQPKTKDYGILTLMVDYLSTANIELIVPSNSFIPAPNVTSAVIKLKREKKYSVKNEKILYDLIHGAFAKRRKKMINSLESVKFMNMTKQEITDVLNSSGLNENVRAEELSIEEYINLSNEFSNIE